MKSALNRGKIMRHAMVVLSLLLCPLGTAAGQVSVSIGLPDVSIGINLPVYPQFVLVPGYPVYYAPQVNSNYFFYDGMYWVYQQDNWYASSWYNGPWGLVSENVVPLFILRIPVRYYRRPPAYFRGWSSDAPPRWGDHWGNAWEERRSGWDTWSRNSVPQAAPLPVYQRRYAGSRYPRVDQQQVLQRQNYRYQPHDATVKEVYQAQGTQSASTSAPAPSRQTRQGMAQSNAAAPPEQRTAGRPASPPQSRAMGTREQAAQPERAEVRSSVTAQTHPQQKGPAGPAQVQEQHVKQGPEARSAPGQAKQGEEKRPRPQAKQGEEKRPQPQAKGTGQEPRRDQQGSEKGG